MGQRETWIFMDRRRRRRRQMQEKSEPLVRTPFKLVTNFFVTSFLPPTFLCLSFGRGEILGRAVGAFYREAL